MTTEVPKKNIDLEKLGLINQDLFAVEGGLAKKYNHVLKEAFGFECDVDSFRVDKRGLSPELCAYLKKKYPDKLEFGENYLNIGSANQFIIIVSPDQKSAPLIAQQTSYENGLIDSMYEKARHTIEEVTQDELLFGEIENRINVFRTADDLLRLRMVEVTLDTIDHTVVSILELGEMAARIGEDDNALNPEYISRMQEIVKKVGNINERAISDVFPIKKEIHCFFAEFFKGVHCLRNFKSTEKIKTIFVSHHQECHNNFGQEITALDLHDQELLGTLAKYNFLEYAPSLIKQKMEEIEDEVLLYEGLDVVELTPQQKKLHIIKLFKKFPEVYRELGEIEKIVENSGASRVSNAIKDASYETLLKLSRPASKAEIINHMLAELDSTDVPRVYEFNRRKLVTEFPGLPLNRQRYIAHKLLQYKTGGK